MDYQGKLMNKAEFDLKQFVGQYKVTLVGFFMNQYGEYQVRDFMNHFSKYDKDPTVGRLTLNVQENTVKSPIMRLLVPYIRSQLPVQERDRYAILFQNIAQERRRMGMENGALGWVNLVDDKARIRWQAHGQPLEHELASLDACVLKLKAV